jgi:spore coat polysaccharide biosynthesis predicted glycosyltransferase SpsG
MGVPLLTGVIADNQEAIAAALKRAKLADVIGWYAHIPEQKLAAHIDQMIVSFAFRRDLSLNGQRTVDGKGVMRVLDQLESLSA